MAMTETSEIPSTSPRQAPAKHILCSWAETSSSLWMKMHLADDEVLVEGNVCKFSIIASTVLSTEP